ncbi:uncharacterized protein B0P05DRAFT_532907 [Gilbertella persicaria]|uniref:uncharacterized protein n=1 Tax=Gilbertella persicaria TaxID=101096 RepID=UPI00221F2EC3|nr:uncharacterized protein B0P05DRAFT_532907 [Gilbertella persicaria]KAI8086909.1 hypothetical protein B0P05DRAFT_532907 [Gilbertella persicaria]
MSNHKRSRSPSIESDTLKRVRVDNNNNESLLAELSQVLNTIKSTPSSGEISAEVMETFKILLLEIDHLSADNAEARRVKQESELCLESWFDDLLAQCEADGELNLEDFCQSDEEEAIAFAISQEQQQDEGDDEEEEIIIVDDDGSEPLAVL